jgi:cytochrome c oxidase assembly protein subunit 15
MNQVASEKQQLLNKSVRIWLLIGLIMVFFQVVIGGITRLTDSGLSITEWAVIQGTLPPMNETDWLEAFEAYKTAARKQYESLHADMTLSEFKFIYFWEYIHRLWARLMGFVFIFPFFFFLYKKWMPRWLLRRLGIVILLAALAATFGWIMVASGLNDDSRTWVSAYKLIIHLSIATALFSYLWWTYLLGSVSSKNLVVPKVKKWAWGLTILLLVQIVFGGLMAGMRAGVLHPYFPLFVKGGLLWDALTASSQAGLEQIIDYEPNLSVKALVQIIHRVTAYALLVLGFFFIRKLNTIKGDPALQRAAVLFGGVLVLQFVLGVLTVINSIGKIPLTYGVLHQAGALILLGSLLFVNYRFKKKSTNVENYVN